jgi:hypothetical protein
MDVDAQIGFHHGVMIYLYFYPLLWVSVDESDLPTPLWKLINELSIDF